MKLLLDMPMPQRTAAWLRGKGFDAIHTRDIGMKQAADHEILEHARREGRIVLTMDLDFPHLLAEIGSAEPGVILLRFRNPTPAAIQERLAALFQTVPEADLAHAIAVVEENRVRLHRLPLK